MQQQTINEGQEVKNAENSLFKWAITVTIGLLFTFIGIIYGYLRNADAAVENDVKELKAHEITDAKKFQNIENNIYIICKAQKLNCIPPIE